MIQYVSCYNIEKHGGGCKTRDNRVLKVFLQTAQHDFKNARFTEVDSRGELDEDDEVF